MSGKIIGIIFFSLQISSSLWAQNEPAKTVMLSPVPLYPLDGIIPPELRNEEVYLDTKTWDLIVPSAITDENLPQNGEANAGGKEYRIRLANHVRPEIRSKLTLGEKELFQYQYTVRNMMASRDCINKWLLVVPRPDAPNPALPVSPDPVAEPPGWEHEYYAASPGVWTIKFETNADDAQIRPNAMVVFTIKSTAMPGVTRAYFQGGVKNEPFPTGLSARAIEKIALCYGLEFNSVAVEMIGPKYPPQIPKIIIAGDYHSEISRLVNEGILKENSHFIQEVLSTLDEYIRSQDIESEVAFIPPKHMPDLGLERDILEALKYSLSSKIR
jgi:hypothetical protein